jgi:hypothetical protein
MLVESRLEGRGSIVEEEEVSADKEPYFAAGLKYSSKNAPAISRGVEKSGLCGVNSAQGSSLIAFDKKESAFAYGFAIGIHRLLRTVVVLILTLPPPKPVQTP